MLTLNLLAQFPLPSMYQVSSHLVQAVEVQVSHADPYVSHPINNYI